MIAPHMRTLALIAFAAWLAAPAVVAAQAAGCRRVDAHAGEQAAPGQPVLVHDATFRCILRRGGPARTVVVVADGRGPTALRIQGAGGRRGQSFALGDANQDPPPGRRFFRGEDLNGDGWLELMVLTGWGAHLEEWHEVFRYDPAGGRFTHDAVLSGSRNIARIPGRRCVAVTSRGADARSRTENCWSGRRWRRMREERVAPADVRASPWVWVRTRRELRGGRMRVVGVDTIP